MSIALLFDPNKIQRLTMEKLMIAIPLFYAFASHYIFHIIHMIKGKNAHHNERINDFGRRLFLFGMICLLNINFIQGSAIGAVCAWAQLVLFIIGHCLVFIKETRQRQHNIVLLTYYGILFLWFICLFLYYLLTAFT